MENRAYAIAVGLFTLVLGAGVVFIVMWFSGDTEKRDVYRLESRFAVTGLVVRHARRVGTAHLKCALASLGGATVEGIAFGAVGTGLGDLLERVPGQPLHLVGHVEINVWQGRRSVQLRIDDAAPA